MIRSSWGNYKVTSPKIKGNSGAEETGNEDNGQPQSRNDGGNAQFPPYPSKITSVENKVYFYADIDDLNILELNRTLSELSNVLLWRAQVTFTTPAPIYLYIHSNGGSIFSGLSAMDEILNCQVPVVTVIDGIAASAATFLSCVGQKRLMKRHSFVLIHQLSTGFWGTYENFLDEKENLDKLMNMIKGVYKEYSKIPMSKLNQILKRDLYLTAEEAVQYGLVDDII